jgi:rhodanese-related sulfurtransferase
VAEPSRAETANWVDWAEGIDWAGWNDVREPEGLVRPYAWTAGRTASHLELSVETLISGTPQLLAPTAPPEHRSIVALCAAPRSVAELAALLSIPLGVVRVVLGDMAESGTIVVHCSAGLADAAPDLNLMRRVLHGLQRL